MFGPGRDLRIEKVTLLESLQEGTLAMLHCSTSLGNAPYPELLLERHSVHSHSNSWNYVTWPHLAAREAGKCLLAEQQQIKLKAKILLQ